MYAPFYPGEMHTGNTYSCCLVAEGWFTFVSTGRNVLHAQHFIQTCTQRKSQYYVNPVDMLACHFSYTGWTHRCKNVGFVLNSAVE